MIRRSWSHTRADMQGADWGKNPGGKERWRKGKLTLFVFGDRCFYYSHCEIIICFIKMCKLTPVDLLHVKNSIVVKRNVSN